MIRRLKSNGILHFITAEQAAKQGLGGAKSVDDLRGVQGMYASGKAYVIADNLTAKNIGGVILHEIGTHLVHNIARALKDRQ